MSNTITVVTNRAQKSDCEQKSSGKVQRQNDLVLEFNVRVEELEREIKYNQMDSQQSTEHQHCKQDSNARLHCTQKQK